MIQPINESEKNRIKNLHREHFILNEETENKDMGMDFWLEELSEFAIHLENGSYEEYDGMGEYDIENIKTIIRHAGEDKSLSDNDLTIVTEYGHDIHKDIIDIISRTSFLNENEEVAVDKLATENKPKYCKGGSMENKLLSKIKTLGGEAKDKLKELYGKIKGKSVKELLGILKEARKAKKSTKNLNESVGAVVIAGVSIPGGIFIAVGALIIILIIVTILNKRGRGCGNPFDRL
jgi:hypothetical protein